MRVLRSLLGKKIQDERKETQAEAGHLESAVDRVRNFFKGACSFENPVSLEFQADQA